VFGVLCYVDSVAVVCDRDGAIIADFEFDACDGESVGFRIADCLLLANEMIATIDGAFVEQFVETRDVVNCAMHDGRCSGIVDKCLGFGHFNRADICVGFFEDMFLVGHFLIFSEFLGRSSYGCNYASASAYANEYAGINFWKLNRLFCLWLSDGDSSYGGCRHFDVDVDVDVSVGV